MLDEQPSRPGEDSEADAGSVERRSDESRRKSPRRTTGQRPRAGSRRQGSAAKTRADAGVDAAGPPLQAVPRVASDNSAGAETSTDSGDGHNWLDRDAGPVVRPYTVTGGRARPATGSLDLLSYVEALYVPDADLVDLQPEHRSILSLTRTALSVAEIAAYLDLPVGVVRVLIGDLVQAHLVSTFSSGSAVHPPDENTLQAVIDGLRAL
jgi:hypothetical protein